MTELEVKWAMLREADAQCSHLFWLAVLVKAVLGMLIFVVRSVSETELCDMLTLHEG